MVLKKAKQLSRVRVDVQIMNSEVSHGYGSHYLFQFFKDLFSFSRCKVRHFC